MDWIHQTGHIAYVAARDFYHAAQPYFGFVFVAIVCLAIVAFLHNMYAENLRESLRALVHEMEAATQKRRDPSALNFLFGVFLVIVSIMVFLASEASDTVREFFLRETSDPNAMFAKGVIGILLAFFLLVFFIWSINLSVKFRAKP